MSYVKFFLHHIDQFINVSYDYDEVPILDIAHTDVVTIMSTTIKCFQHTDHLL